MTTRFLSRCALAGAIALVLPLDASLRAQDGGPGTGGAVRIAQELRALASPYRVLVIGAHPDDEDNDLIAILSRGWGVETAYLSLTRGEGGQNLIGGELGAALGVVRGGELVAARRVDGGRQYFTRAYDFGFTRSVEETFRFWPRDSVLKDVVRVIRRFRPHVIVSVFSGTPRDGHGQHQAAGILALEGFHAAADPARFPELEREETLRPWTTAKLYRDYGVQDGIVLDAGVLDPATGMSLHQIGRRSRSQHRSQDMGTLEEPGPASVRIALEVMAPGIRATADDSLFAGIVAEGDPADRRHADLARMASAGIVLDAYVDETEVVPGQQVPLTVVGWNAGNAPVRLRFETAVTGGWTVAADPDRCFGRDTTLTPGMQVRCRSTLLVRDDAPLDQPYYLVEAMDGAMYQWVGQRDDWGEPHARPLQVATRAVFPDSTEATQVTEVTARRLDQGMGELRDPVHVMPRVVLDVTPGQMVWRRGLTERLFTVTVEHLAADTTAARVALEVPPGWTVDTPRTVVFTREGERRALSFRVRAPRAVQDGEVTFHAIAEVEGRRHGLSVRRVDYPHIRPHPLFLRAEAAVVVAPVQFAAGRRIGYLRGAADAIPEALDAAGVPFRLLSAADLDGAVLDSLDVMVIGPRAYEISDALRRAHPRLVRFAERGGTLMIQYQQYQFIAGGFAPLPMTIARPHDRVTDENAPIRWLPGSELIRTGPNRLIPRDFDDWVQERGLYFAGTWDAAWTPLIEMTDPGEPPRQGGLLVANFGRGKVIYTGIAFFRQLPAAVPGAWRLFANLLAL